MRYFLLEVCLINIEHYWVSIIAEASHHSSYPFIIKACSTLIRTNYFVYDLDWVTTDVIFQHSGISGHFLIVEIKYESYIFCLPF